MHEPTNPLVSTPSSPLRGWIEKSRMAPSQEPGGDVSRPTKRFTSTAHISDAITVLRGKRDRYKAAGRGVEARTVQGCIDLLREVFK